MEVSEVLEIIPKKRPKLESGKPQEQQHEKPLCIYGSGCYRRSPSHLRIYRHLPPKQESQQMILPACKNGANCYDRNLLHFAFYYHPTSTSESHNSERPENGVIVQQGRPKAYESTPKSNEFPKEKEEVDCVSRNESIMKRGPSIMKSYSILTEAQRKELLKRAFEMKQDLIRKLNDTENVLKSKTEELEMLRLKLDRNTLLVDGEAEAMTGTQIRYFPLFPQRKYKEDSASEIHFRLAESQFYRLLPPGSAYKVTKVEYVVQPTLINRFKEARQKIANVRGEDSSYPVLGFHGTREQNIESICETGFRVPGENGFEHATDPGWYGKGVYFSEYPRYSMNYIKDSSKLLLCQVLPGKVYRCRYIIQGESLRQGYDSHMSPDGKEVVIFNSHHILPSYIVHYTFCHGDFRYEKNE